ncbi:aldose 1-epimerase [Microlunatus speluncae]|uniref:aldose 1-epimerase n=1 Tax=Microlunatus speluncae TaxID=2594267 RepID=UPI001266745E|nr:aldose 1-epimerase [Microlunatus speluncae]
MNDHRRPEQLLLETDRSRAVFSTEAGRLTGLAFDGRELIVGPPDEPQPGPWFWGSFVMAPWTSLIRDARFDFRGQTHRLAADDGRHAVLGLTWKLPWRIDGDRLSCDLTDSAGTGWPFGVRVLIMPELTADRLRVVLRVEAAEHELPAAIGWHPWFVRQLAGSGPVELGLAGPVWRQHRDEAEAPTGLWQSVDPAERDFNDCLQVNGPTTLTWPGVGELEIGHDSPWVTVYSVHPRGICVEPVTSPAERMDHLLAPGESLDLTIDLTWRAAPIVP